MVVNIDIFHPCNQESIYINIWTPAIMYMYFAYIFIVTVSDQMVDLWTCSKHVQRKKSDLCEIDIVMSSLRDIGHEML